MIRRIIGAAALCWALGFVVFVLMLPGPLGPLKTDAIVVPTGGPGRIARGITLLQAGEAKRMLVTGVGRGVKPLELARAQKLPPPFFACCIDLDREAVDTRSNGEETAAWFAKHDYKSIRLVTTDWHMPRARFELARMLGSKVTIVADAVQSEPSLSVLLREYHKYLLRRAAVLIGL